MPAELTLHHGRAIIAAMATTTKRATAAAPRQALHDRVTEILRDKITDGVLRFRIFKVDPSSPAIVPPPAMGTSAGAPPRAPRRQEAAPDAGAPEQAEEVAPEQAEETAPEEAEEAAPEEGPSAPAAAAPEPAEAAPEEPAAEAPSEPGSEPTQ